MGILSSLMNAANKAAGNKNKNQRKSSSSSAAKTYSCRKCKTPTTVALINRFDSFTCRSCKTQNYPLQ